MKWEAINKELGLPIHNKAGEEIRLGRRYMLLTAEGDLINRTAYLAVGYELEKVQLQDAGGFKFFAKPDGLTAEGVKQSRIPEPKTEEILDAIPREPYRFQKDIIPAKDNEQRKLDDMLRSFNRPAERSIQPWGTAKVFTAADLVAFVKHCDKIRNY